MEAVHEPLPLTVNGVALPASLGPEVAGGHVLVPVVALAVALGGEVEELADRAGVRLTGAGHPLVFFEGQATATVGPGSEAMSLPVPPRWRRGQLMVPLEPVAAALGLTIRWEPETGLTLTGGGGPGLQGRSLARFVGIEWTRPGGVLTLSVRVVGTVTHQVHILTDPPRRVIDLSPARLVDLSAAWPGAPGIRAVRVAQFQPDTVRIVLDLEEPFFVVPAGGEEGVLRFQLLRAFPLPAVENGADGVTLRLPGLSDLVAPFALREPPRLVMDFPGYRLPGPTRLLPGGGAVRSVRVGQVQPDTVRLVVNLGDAVDYWLQRGEGETVLRFGATGTGGQGTYRGDADLPLANRRIVLDPGHGGEDPGAVGAGGTREADVNLAVARHVAALLREAGAYVILTRTGDTYPSWEERVGPANAPVVADAFVSIHSNAFFAPWAEGTETYYYPGRPGADLLARAVHKAVVAALGLPDRGIKVRADFYVLRRTTGPAILVELGFLSNPSEEKRLADPKIQRKAARGIFDGLLAYFRGSIDGNTPPPTRAPLPWVTIEPSRTVEVGE